MSTTAEPPVAPSVQVTCLNCNATFDVRMQMHHGEPIADLGYIKCTTCSMAWCACSTHGRYEAPPPCPHC